MTRCVVGILSLAMIVFGASGASSQDYPNKPIRILTTAVGGSNDLEARLIAPALAVSLRQPVVVDNRGGGGIASEITAAAPPDGYTLHVNGPSMWVVSLFRKIPYDPVGDFSPITLVSKKPNILVVHPSLPVKSVKELIALAKSKPGGLNYASGIAGTASHIATELFKSMAGVDIVHVAYKGGAASLVALLGNEVHMTISDLSPVEPHVKSGRLRGVALTSTQPSVLFPGLPTIAEFLPGYEAVTATGVYAPAKTPAVIVNRLNQEIVRFLRTPEAKQKFFDAGVEPVGSSPAELATFIKSDLTRLGKLIKDTGIKVD